MSFVKVGAWKAEFFNEIMFTLAPQNRIIF